MKKRTMKTNERGFLAMAQKMEKELKEEYNIAKEKVYRCSVEIGICKRLYDRYNNPDELDRLVALHELAEEEFFIANDRYFTVKEMVEKFKK